jgi:hypothetical protein
MPGNDQGPSYQPGPRKINPLPEITICVDCSGASVTGTLSEITFLLADEQELNAVRHILNAVWDHSESPHALEFLKIVDDVVHRQYAA